MNKVNLRAADRLAEIPFITAASIGPVLQGDTYVSHPTHCKIRAELGLSSDSYFKNCALFLMFLLHTDAATNWAICQELGIPYSAPYAQPAVSK